MSSVALLCPPRLLSLCPSHPISFSSLPRPLPLPFAIDAFEDEKAATGGTGNKVHIRIQQRNRRKCILTVSGLDDDLDLKKISKYLKKKLNCNGAVVNDKVYGDVLQMQGDHRTDVRDFLVAMKIVQSDQIIMHGF